VDEAHAALLAECDAELPPIVVHRPTMRVIDGMHRLRAATRRGQREIAARFFDGDEAEAFVLAVELNIAHGLPLSLADRKAAARRILAADARWSNRAVAAKTGLSDKTVAVLRACSGADIPHPGRRVGRDGHLHPVDSTAGRRRAAELLSARPQASLREVAAQAEVSPGVVSAVRKQLEAYAGQQPASPSSQVPTAGCAPSGPGRTAPSAPVAGRRTPGRGAGHERDYGGVREMLDRLRRDPSLRYTDDGRRLLGWLSAKIISEDDLPSPAPGLPDHNIPVLAALARRCSCTWLELAQRLEDDHSRRLPTARDSMLCVKGVRRLAARDG